MFNWFRRKKKNAIPYWIWDYQSLTFKNSSDTSIDEISFVVLDCETSGLKKTDRLITIGAVKCNTKEIYLDKVLDQKYPEIEVGRSAEIHGELTSETVTDKAVLTKELIDFLKNHIIVGHNIAFDIQMINSLLDEMYHINLKNKVLDTAHMVMRLDPVHFERTVGGKSMLHLDDLCEKYDIEIANRHTALGDAYLTAQLLQRLLSGLKKRGVNTIGQLMK